MSTQRDLYGIAFKYRCAAAPVTGIRVINRSGTADIRLRRFCGRGGFCFAVKNDLHKFKTDKTDLIQVIKNVELQLLRLEKRRY